MRKFFSLLIVLSITLTGCSSSASLNPMTFDDLQLSRVEGVKRSLDDVDSFIYTKVSDSVLVDSSVLLKPADKDVNNINELLNKLHSFIGRGVGDGVAEHYANYILFEMVNTPYTWQVAKTDILGFDGASRLFFVDVTYQTTSLNKYVIPKSKIPLGSPNYDALSQKRYSDYTSILTLKSMGSHALAAPLEEAFTRNWGSPAEVRAEQQGVTLLERLRTRWYDDANPPGLGALTYNGSLSNLASGTMTFRYVMQYNLNLGEERGLLINAVYLKDYNLTGGTGISQASVQGSEVLTPFIKSLLDSYFKAEETSNYIGLYSMFTDFASIDKYYEDLSNYVYINTPTYRFNIVSRNGDMLKVLVTRQVQRKAKGSETSYPTYEEDLLFDLYLSPDDKVKINNITLVKSTLTSEPLSVVKDVTSISEKMQYSTATFTNENKAKIEELLKSFGDVVITKSTDSQQFASLLDKGIQTSVISSMVDTINSVQGNPTKKVTYIKSWGDSSNSYASVTLREIFTGGTGTYDTEAVVGLVNRGGDWKIVSYTRLLNVKLDSNIVNTDNAFVVNSVQGRVVN
jgi:hypothetical protein